MRRRRKTKYTWLPILPGPEIGGTDATFASWQNFFLDIGAAGAQVTGTIPVLEDTPQDPGTGEGIGEIIGNEYLLKRIVGKAFISLSYLNAGNTAQEIAHLNPIIVTAGFFVARADPANYSTPIAPVEGNVLYSPSTASLTRQPWIWRRSWIMHTSAGGSVNDTVPTIAGNTAINGYQTFPGTNVAYGSVADGPHIDAKTGRRVRLEERLWFSLTGATYNAGPVCTSETVDVTAQVNVQLDCRYLGAMRKPRGRSNFA